MQNTSLTQETLRKGFIEILLVKKKEIGVYTLKRLI